MVVGHSRDGPMPQMTLLVSIENATDRALHGGKGKNLAQMIGHGFVVPKGAVVPSTEFDRHLDTCQMGADSDYKALATKILAQPVLPELVQELQELVAELGGRVSVRSSATA